MSTGKTPSRSGLGLLGAIGGYVALSLLIGLGAGWILDRVLGTAPLFLITGVVLGFITSFYLTYRLAIGDLAE